MKSKILMVCLGNICRSPLAESLLRSKVDSKNVTVDSAGTANYHVGQQPDERMTATGKKHGLDLSSLRGRQFTQEDFSQFDHIYVMDNSNYTDVVKLATTEEERAKVTLILDEIMPGENCAVPDPYYGGDQGFEHVYDLLDQSTDKIAAKLL